MSVNTKYQAFTIEDQVIIVEGKGGFPTIKIDNDHATSTISIYGAQVLSYVTKANSNTNETSNNDLLFVSENAYFEQGKAIKGGIPICWPWFGRDPENKGRQMHGFARNLLWEIEKVTQLDAGETQVVLSLKDTDETQELFLHEFHLALTIEIGQSLKLSMKTTNTSDQTFKITQALHSYFSVSDISNAELEGLGGTYYLDKVTNSDQPTMQNGNIVVDQEVDRIYVDAPNKLTLHDSGNKRKVGIQSDGSKTTIVWNPWIDISKNSGDLTDDAYQQFICVETANAVEDMIEVEPQSSYTIEAEYQVS